MSAYSMIRRRIRRLASNMIHIYVTKTTTSEHINPLLLEWLGSLEATTYQFVNDSWRRRTKLLQPALFVHAAVLYRGKR